ncbi:YoaK family protein [Streptomyces sp. cg36]|uniref:YoaK family protein n=1 Tax=Streptomyces sp. cg36 TaxID=3238798 RepID=UPI0034E2092A
MDTSAYSALIRIRPPNPGASPATSIARGDRPSPVRCALRRIAGSNPLPGALVGLTMVTGMLDVISFLGLGKVFLAMMTGNVIFLGAAVGGTAGLSAAREVLAFACFATGIVIGARTERFAAQRARRHWFFLAMSAEIALLAGAVAAVWLMPSGSDASQYVAIALLALAMGARCATVRRLGVTDMPVTVGVTGALIALVHDSPLAGAPASAFKGRRLGMVLAMGTGAAFGAFLMGNAGLRWALVAVLLCVVVITVAVRLHPRHPVVTDR